MSIEASIESLTEQLATTRAELDRIATPITPKSYTTENAGKALGVDASVIRRMIRSGQLPTVTLPTMREVRIPAAALDALVAPERWSTTNLGAAS